MSYCTGRKVLCATPVSIYSSILYNVENIEVLPLDRKHLLTHLVKQPYKKHSRGQHCTYSINTPIYPAHFAPLRISTVISQAFSWGVTPE